VSGKLPLSAVSVKIYKLAAKFISRKEMRQSLFFTA
jgi:hypothetical protein